MEIFSVNDMLHQKALTFYYKYVNKILPYFFDSFDITTQGSLHNYNTRQRNKVRLNRTRIKMTDKCLRNYLPEQLNSLPHIVSGKIYTHSLHGFSSAVKRFTLDNYSTAGHTFIYLYFHDHFAKSADLFDRDCLIPYHFHSIKVIAVMIFTENGWPLW